MPLRRMDSMSLFRHLLIACALLGFHLDVLPLRDGIGERFHEVLLPLSTCGGHEIGS